MSPRLGWRNGDVVRLAWVTPFARAIGPQLRGTPSSGHWNESRGVCDGTTSTDRVVPMSSIHKSRAARQLVAYGKYLFARPREQVVFTGDPECDRLLNDIRRFPHLYVLGCVVDVQMKSELAWMIPIRLAERAGSAEFQSLLSLRRTSLLKQLNGPPALHRYPVSMALRLWSALQRLQLDYAGDASRIWSARPSSATVAYRFLEFDGIGPKLANMATNILARQFKIPFRDYYSIDVSVDVHVRRVLARLGLVAVNPTVEQVVYAARSINPEFPGVIDQPCFEIGRKWCKSTLPTCPECPLHRVCPYSRDI